MRNVVIDYADCLASLEPRRLRRTQIWGLDARVAVTRRSRWLMSLSALLPAALLAAFGWRP